MTRFELVSIVVMITSLVLEAIRLGVELGKQNKHHKRHK